MSTADAPLAGIRVVEITNIYSGPYAGMMLAELGADVIKVEAPDGPDLIRASGLGAGPDSVNPTFYALNRGKRFVSIDARTAEGRELFTEFAATADVFLHNIRPGKPEPLGVGYEELAARNPRLVYVAISGFGTDGPESHKPAYDYVIQAQTGIVDHQRDLRSRQSDLVHNVMVDKTSANAAVQAVLAALFVRERTGQGQRIDIPMIATGLHFLWPDGMAPFHSQVEPSIPHEHLPPHLLWFPSSALVVLPTLDGEIATGILLPPWDGLCLALDRVDLLTDERFTEAQGRAIHLPALIEQLAGEVAKYTTAEVLARFEAHDFAAARVVHRAEVHLDETIQHLGVLVEQDVPGIGPVRQPTPPWHFADSTARVTSSIGRTGEHSVEVLREHGVDEARLDDLLARGVIRQQ